MIKRSVALAIADPVQPGAVLLVQRPEHDADLPGVWGLPAASLAGSESWQDAAYRAGLEKLGVDLAIGAAVAEGTAERSGYTLHMRLYGARIARGSPQVPQSAAHVTQYQAWRWGTRSDLVPAAARGSLCSTLFLGTAGAAAAQSLQSSPPKGGFMEQIASDLIDNSELIARRTLEDWKDLADREPWHRLPPELDMDHLPQLIRDLARTALGSFFGAEERRDLAVNSVKHGEHRFETAASEEMLSREYELLRWSLWQRLKAMWPSEDASQAIIRLDSALGFAHGATLRGYHRRVIEQTGDWPDALDRYLEEWAFPFR